MVVEAGQSGGQINEQTTHIVDLAHYLVGDVTQVFGAASHKPRPDFPGLDVATASSATLKFASGAVGNIGSTCLLGWNHRVGLHLFGDRLAIEMTDHDIMVDVGRGRPYRHAEGDPSGGRIATSSMPFAAARTASDAPTARR